MSNNPQVPWTDEQWTRVNQVIQEEAGRARVAASFLPLYGPLPPDTDFIRKEEMQDGGDPMRVADREIIQLATLQVRVSLRGAQMADPDMSSALALFRRAAYVVCRLEDAMVFNGWTGPPANRNNPHGAPPQVWEIHGEGPGFKGLLDDPLYVDVGPDRNGGLDLVKAVSEAIGDIEKSGYFGPFAVVLDQKFFLDVETPNEVLVLPQDRIIPFLGGGPLLRSSTLPDDSGVVVALGGAQVELVISKDLSLQFLQMTNDPRYHFRVYEKMALRIKAKQAIRRLRKAPAKGKGRV
jgi:hypothetical protein